MRSYYYVVLISIKIYNYLCLTPFPLEPFAAGFIVVPSDVEANPPPMAPASSFGSSRHILKIDIKF